MSAVSFSRPRQAFSIPTFPPPAVFPPGSQVNPHQDVQGRRSVKRSYHPCQDPLAAAHRLHPCPLAMLQAWALIFMTVYTSIPDLAFHPRPQRFGLCSSDTLSRSSAFDASGALGGDRFGAHSYSASSRSWALPRLLCRPRPQAGGVRGLQE